MPSARRRLFNVGQRFCHHKRRLWSFLRLLGQELHDQVAEAGRHVGIDYARRLRRFQRQGRDDGDGVLALERQLAGAHAVEHAAEAEQVAAVIDVAAGGLLGRHERRRADNGPGLREVRLVAGRAGQSEVEDLGAELPGLASGARLGFFQPQVRWLDVAMNQPVVVGGGQALRHLAANAKNVCDRRDLFALEKIVERFARQKLHRQKWGAAVLADLVDRDDMIVLERGGSAGLAQKSFPGRRAGRQGGEHGLQSDEPLQVRVFGFEDDPHTAGP